jgi:hypothetical protein
VISTAASWSVGIVLTNGDAAFTLANVVAHGVPYFALVHHVGRRQWADGEGALSPRWFAPAALGAFLALPLLVVYLLGRVHRNSGHHRWTRSSKSLS